MKYFIFLAMLPLIFSCDTKLDEDDNCVEYRQAAILETDIPSEVELNTDRIFKITYAVVNGCGTFDNFIRTKVNDTLYVEMEALYTGCVCTQDVPVYDTFLTYQAINLGTNYIRFLSTFEQSFLVEFEVIN